MSSTLKLVDDIPKYYASATTRKIIFSDVENDSFKKYDELEKQTTGISCTTNLFFGFFFDGTKNNYELAEVGKNHSNVARLYDCFPGLSTTDMLPDNAKWKHDKDSYNHFFRVYAPGVSSPFKEVKDTGKGLEGQAGGAVGYMGEERILWALVQAINNVHRYFLGTVLMSSDQTLALLKHVKLVKSRRQRMKLPEKIDLENPDGDAADQTRMEFEQVLRSLDAAVAVHMPKGECKPKRIDPAIVQTIHVSIFGFSRGATQARVFSNWLMSLCALDASLCGKKGRMTLAGFDVKFDFLGIFDTIASVGAGNTWVTACSDVSLTGMVPGRTPRIACVSRRVFLASTLLRRMSSGAVFRSIRSRSGRYYMVASTASLFQGSPRTKRLSPDYRRAP